jgi:hypothetical protein
VVHEEDTAGEHLHRKAAEAVLLEVGKASDRLAHGAKEKCVEFTHYTALDNGEKLEIGPGV